MIDDEPIAIAQEAAHITPIANIHRDTQPGTSHPARQKSWSSRTKRPMGLQERGVCGTRQLALLASLEEESFLITIPFDKYNLAHTQHARLKHTALASHNILCANTVTLC